MKSKKLLSGLMALSVIFSSSLIIGTTAKAATLNSTSSTLLLAKATTSSLQADISSKGIAQWVRVQNGVRYEFILRTASGSQIVKFGGGTNYTSQDVRSYVSSEGEYSIEVTAYDSNNKVLANQKFYFDYESGKFISHAN